MDIAVGIINWNSGHWLKDCIQSLLAAEDVAEIAVVDNASTDGSFEAARACSDRVQLVQNRSNLGFAAGVNQAFAATSAPYVLILNPDIRIEPSAVKPMGRFLMDHPGAAAVGAHIGSRYLPRRLPTAISLIRENLGIPKRPTEPSGKTPIEVDQPAAGALMVRRLAFDAVGGFDTRFFPAWYEDVDFCKRLKLAGWQLYFDPGARFVHEGGYSAKALGVSGFAAAYYHNQLRYARKHLGVAAGLAIRGSLVVGMAARAIVAPARAGASMTVLSGALWKW